MDFCRVRVWPLVPGDLPIQIPRIHDGARSNFFGKYHGILKLMVNAKAPFHGNAFRDLIIQHMKVENENAQQD
jgi:hypothetical protein